MGGLSLGRLKLWSLCPNLPLQEISVPGLLLPQTVAARLLAVGWCPSASHQREAPVFAGPSGSASLLIN